MTILSERGIAEIGPDDLGPRCPVIWLNDFSQESAKSFFEAMSMFLSNEDIHSIVIYIDSFGGEVDALATIAELIETSTKPVYTCVIGKAFSAGAILASLGTPGHRYCSPNSRMMYHRIAITEFETPAEKIMHLAKEIVRVNDLWLKKVVAKSKMDWKKFNESLDKCGGEWFLSAKEAQKLGLIDHIGVPRITEIRQWRIETSEK